MWASVINWSLAVSSFAPCFAITLVFIRTLFTSSIFYRVKGFRSVSSWRYEGFINFDICTEVESMYHLAWGRLRKIHGERMGKVSQAFRVIGSHHGYCLLEGGCLQSPSCIIKPQLIPRLKAQKPQDDIE